MIEAHAAGFIFHSLPVYRINRPASLLQARGHHCGLEVAMHVSDVLLECAKECARLSRECGDERIAAAIFEVSTRLLATATYDAELVMGDAEVASLPAGA